MQSNTAAKIEAQTPDFKRELDKLSDFAFCFLNASNGDTAEAEALLVSTWRYRILLAGIREGL